MPAFYSVILVRFLVIYQGLDCDCVEVVGVSIGGIVDGTWFRLFRVCCDGWRAEEEREQGGGEVGAHCDLERRVCRSGQVKVAQKATFPASCDIIAWNSFWMENVGYNEWYSGSC